MIPPPLPYHRLARAFGYRWWRPLLELVLTLLFGSVAAILLVTVIAGQVDDVGGASGMLLLGASLVPYLPAALLAARVVGRPPGSLSSVRFRLRWHWLARCTVAALAVMLMVVVVYAIVAALGGAPPGDGAETPGWPGWHQVWAPLLAVLLVIPFQAAAEEYVFRGTLLQAVGACAAPAWIAIAVSSVLFAAAHGLGAAGFFALLGFGAITAWLTVRTGGLEAAIGLHVVNNVVMFVLIALGGGAETWLSELNQELTWPATIVDLAGMLGYAAVVVRMASARAIARTARPLEPRTAWT